MIDHSHVSADRRSADERCLFRAIAWPVTSAMTLSAMLYCSAVAAAPVPQVGRTPIDAGSSGASEPLPSVSRFDSVELPVKITNRPLGELLDELAQRSGIRFHVTASLRMQDVTATLSGSSWNDAIKGLLRRYNHLAIVDRNGMLQRVWITGFDARDVTAERTAPANGVDVEQDAQLEEQPGAKVDAELPVALWQPASRGVMGRSDIPSAPIEVDPLIFDALRVGQPLELDIPQELGPVFGVIGETHDQLGGQVQVWSGPVDGSHDSASFTISRGTRTTYVTVATGSKIYEISIDNESGEGSVVDEADMTRGKSDDDIVLPPESEGDPAAPSLGLQ